MTEMGPPIALSYLRVSAEEQAVHGTSLAVQRAECDRYSTGRGWTGGGVYWDVMSGLRDERAQYQALLQRARELRAEGRDAVVVVAALDRLGRRLLERIRVRNELKALGVPVHSVREGGELTDLVANVLAAVAHEEVRRRAARLAASRDHCRDLGWYTGGGLPWGYRWRVTTGAEREAGARRSTLDVDPAAAPTVRHAFRRYARGQSLRQIGTWLATLSPEARGGHILAKQSLPHIFRTPVYVARQRVGDAPVLDRLVARWPAIVTDDVWREIQERLTRRELKRARGRALLTGFVRCVRCDAPAGAGNSGGYQTYVCNHCEANGRPAGYGYICAARTGDRIVLAEVRALLARLAEKPGFARRWTALLRSSGDQSAKDEIDRLTGVAEESSRRLARAGALFISDQLDGAGYELVTGVAQRDLDAATTAIATHRAGQTPQLPSLAAVRRRIRSWMGRLGADTQARRSVLTGLVAQVRVQRVSFKRYAVTIQWTTLGTALHEALDLPCPPGGTIAAASR